MLIGPDRSHANDIESATCRARCLAACYTMHLCRGANHGFHNEMSPHGKAPAQAA